MTRHTPGCAFWMCRSVVDQGWSAVDQGSRVARDDARSCSIAGKAGSVPSDDVANVLLTTAVPGIGDV